MLKKLARLSFKPSGFASDSHHDAEHNIDPKSGKTLQNPSFPKIYTKLGDKGKTSLYSGERVAKSSLTIACLGECDELTSHIGVCREHCKLSMPNHCVLDHLYKIQCRIQLMNSSIATVASESDARNGSKMRRAKGFNDNFSEYVDDLENWIDEFTSELPVLENFILPSGGLASAHLQVTRSICRRAERTVHRLIEGDLASKGAGIFLNRLSDYLFAAARICAQETGNPEEIFKPECSPSRHL